MPAFALVTISLEDRHTFSEYRKLAGPAMAKHKCEPLAVSSEARVIEGEGPAPDVTVILTFPDRDHALAWIGDPEIAAVHQLRQSAGTSRIILM